MSRSWADVKAGWSAGWRELQQTALDRWGEAIRRKPQDFAPKVQATVQELAAARAHLDHMKPLLPKELRTPEDQRAMANFSRLSARYYELAAGVYADAQPAAGSVEQVGIAPLLVVAGLALGIAAIAWAVAAHQYATNLREETALADRELSARIEASKEGRVLPPSTLPPKDDSKPGDGVGWALVGGLALAAGAVVVPVLWKKRGS